MTAALGSTAPTHGRNEHDSRDWAAALDGSAAGVGRTGGSWTTMRKELEGLLDRFSPSELYAVLFVARRLQMGREKYGILNPMDGRDWSLMKAEELADALVYESCIEMQEKVLTS